MDVARENSGKITDKPDKRGYLCSRLLEQYNAKDLKHYLDAMEALQRGETPDLSLLPEEVQDFLEIIFVQTDGKETFEATIGFLEEQISGCLKTMAMQ